MKQLFKIIKNENPIFVLMLGLCSSLAITTKVENAYLMGICIFIVLILSEIITSLIRKIVPDNVKIPVYIVIIGTIVTILEITLKNYIPELHEILGIYLPLIVVNCIILGRVLSVSSKSSVKKSIIDSIGIGIGYTFALVIIAFVREVLGSNTITLMDSISSVTGYRAIYQVFPDNNLIPMSFMTSPAGAFIVLGVLIALYNKIGGRKNESN